MGRIPDGARLVTTPSMPWPTVVMDNVWIMPGVPAIFKMKMPVVLSELGEGGAFVSTQLYTTLDEGVLKPYLDAVVEQFDAVEVGSYPKWRHPDYQTNVTFDGRDETQVEAARDAFATSLPQGSLVEVDESEEP